MRDETGLDKTLALSLNSNGGRLSMPADLCVFKILSSFSTKILETY